MNAPSSHPTTRASPATSNRARAEARDGLVRVMIVDDSLTVRTIFKRMVESDLDMAIAGTASSAEQAIAQLAKCPADIVLLDLEMPGMGGLAALPRILEAAQETQVLVVSSLTEAGAEATLTALAMGAADTMLKPRPGGFNDDYREQLLAKIRALGGISDGSQGQSCDAGSEGNTLAASPAGKTIAPQVVAIGASTGGIRALNLILSRLEPEFDLPIVITQHLPSSFIPVFARQIELVSGRRTLVGENGTAIRAGEIVIATGHSHLIIKKSAGGLITGISNERASSGCLPSVDPMLESLAVACEGKALGVILSGMGRDGAEGARVLAECGGMIYAQDAATSAVWGMPGAVAKDGLASLVADPESLADAIQTLAQRAHSRAL